MNDSLNEEQVNALAGGVLKKLKDGLVEQVADEFYTQMSCYLYDHYTSHKDKVFDGVLAEVVDKYRTEPRGGKFAELRKRMFEDNKETLTATLTDEAIMKSLEKALMEYTHRDYHFNWQWKEGIVKVILQNWDSFKDDPRINDAFGRALQRKDERIKYLEEKLGEVESALNNH